MDLDEIDEDDSSKNKKKYDNQPKSNINILF